MAFYPNKQHYTKEGKQVNNQKPAVHHFSSDNCTSHTWDIVAMVWLWLTGMFHYVFTEKSVFSHSVEPTQSTAKTQAPDKPAGECVIVFENT